MAKARVTRNAKGFFGLTPYLCDYQFLDAYQTIVLYAETEKQLERDFASLKLTVVGEFVCSGEIDYDD